MIKLEGRALQYAATFSASLLSANGGMALFWPSPILPMLYKDSSPIGEKISVEQGSWITSLLVIGSVFGNIFLGVMVNYFGRRGAMLISSVPMFISWIMILFARSVVTLYVARFILGVSSAVPVTISFMYIAETVEPSIRGKLSVICLTAVEATGVMTIVVGSRFYKILAAIGALFPILFFVTFYFMPETPYFHLMKGDETQAEKSLQLFRGKKDVSKELKEMQTNYNKSMNNSTSVLDLIQKSIYRKPLFIVLGLKGLNQLSGSIAFQSNMKSIFQLAKTDLDPDFASFLCVTVPLPVMILASYLIDRLGRKPLYYISSLGCTVALLLETVFFFLQDLPDTNKAAISWLPVTGIFLYFAFRPVGVSSLPHIILNEFFSANVRGQASAVSLVFASALSSIVAFTFPIFSLEFGLEYSFLIFCLICFAAFWFVLIFLPETKGKSLEDIQSNMNEESTSL